MKDLQECAKLAMTLPGCSMSADKVALFADLKQTRLIASNLAEAYFEQRQTIRMLVGACQAAAESFAQVPSGQTVPPIVLHDCKDKLDAAWRSVVE